MIKATFWPLAFKVDIRLGYEMGSEEINRLLVYTITP